MSGPDTVKARVHHGSESLDITIPARVKREFGISPGDVFLVEPEDEEGELVIRYNRIHKTE